MKKILPVVILVVLVAGVLLFVLLRRHDDCAFSGWKQTVGVDVEVAAGDVQAIKTKVGITDQQVRDFDTLMKDFALKYDASCQDFKQNRMSKSEYLCRRNNMDKTLDKIRVFIQKVEAAKTLADPAAQRDVVLKALDDLEASTKAGFGYGCTSAMVVDPTKLLFKGHTSERVVQVTNSGNNPLVFSASALPAGFVATPKTGKIDPGSGAAMAIYRTFEPVSGSVTFHVISNFQDDVPVEITLDSENAGLYAKLGEQTRMAAASQNHDPTLDDALAVVDQSLKGSGSSVAAGDASMRYFLAAGVLSRIGKTTEARRALDTATEKDPALAKEPSALLLKGVVLNQQGDADGALRNFTEARKLVPPQDTDRKALAEVFVGAAAVRSGATMTDVPLNPETQKVVKRNPELQEFVTRQLKIPS